MNNWFSGVLAAVISGVLVFWLTEGLFRDTSVDEMPPAKTVEAEHKPAKSINVSESSLENSNPDKSINVSENTPENSNPDKTSDEISPSNFTSIETYIDNSSVKFSSSNTKVSGKVTRTSIRESAETRNNGVRATIAWDDNVISTILFQESSRVRVWEKGVEYGGTWSWSSTGILRVDMDKGAQYTFQPK